MSSGHHPGTKTTESIRSRWINMGRENQHLLHLVSFNRTDIPTSTCPRLVIKSELDSHLLVKRSPSDGFR